MSVRLWQVVAILCVPAVILVSNELIEAGLIILAAIAAIGAVHASVKP